jgi:RHS repeat-associated protein
MQLASSARIPDGFMAAMRLGGEKPHQGLPGRNPALYQGPTVCNSTTALGLQAAAVLNRIGSCSTGKERDSESGNDYFGARYYASSLGRFMSPDFGGPVPNMPDAVPWADFENPQSLNLYSYGFNGPLTNTDDDGHDVNVCDNSGQCHQMTNDQYAAAQKAGNGGLNVPTLDQVGMNGNGSGQFNSTAITDANGNQVGTATYVSDGPTDYYANRNGLNQLATASATVGSVKGIAAWYGASALGAVALYGSGALAGEELTTLGDIMTTPSAGQTAQAEMVLEQSGKKGVEKAIRTLEKRILQHEEKIQQFRQAGGYTSKAESEIQNFQSLIRAYQSVLK